MRFGFDFNELLALTNRIVTIADNETVSVLQLGMKDLDKKVMCVVRTTTAAEELSCAIAADKPDGFDGKPCIVAVKTKLFAGYISSLASFKENIYIDVTDGTLTLGNSTTKLPTDVLSVIPQGMNEGTQDAPLMQFTVKGSDLSSFMKRALECTDPTDTSGLQNAVMCIDSATGKVRGISSNKCVISSAYMQVNMAKAATPEEEAGYKAMHDALVSFCKENKQTENAVYLLLPSNAVTHIKKLSQGAETVNVGVDCRRVYFSINNSVIYTLVQGRDRKLDFSLIEHFDAMDYEAAAQLDLAEFLRGVDFVKNTSGMSVVDSVKPVRLEFKKGQILVSSGKDYSIKTLVKAGEVKGEGQEVYISGDYLKARLEALEKGGLYIDVKGGVITLANGTLDKKSDYETLICLVNPSNEEESSEAEGDSSSESEAE